MLETIGRDWLIERIEALTEEIEHLKPSDFNEKVRYLPDSVTPRPGFMSFDVNPYMREIVDCCDPRSPVREVNLKKGVQITYSTMLESVLLYYIAHIKTRPSMLVSADRELVKGRIENYILPMLQQSDLAHLIQSSDEGNSRKTGKALCVDTLIPTPAGDRRMGDLRTGDYVFSVDGAPTRIQTESPVHQRESFKFRFANGQEIIASDDHRWTVCPRGNGSGDITLTTREMIEAGVRNGKEYRFRVRVADAAAYADKQFPIEPYTLGAWLGDGATSGAKLTAGDDAEVIVAEIEKDGYFTERKKSHNRCDSYQIKAHEDYRYNVGYGFKAKLDRAGVTGNKHIPEAYFYGSIEQRRRLLQGLMDTDGYASKRGECEITQKNEPLARGVWRLVNSLGLKATISERTARSQNQTKSKVYRVKFWATKSDAPFTIPRKLDRLKDELQSRAKKNTVLSIEPVGSKVVKCIGVEHPSKLFLCGEGHVPTHNTANHLQWAGGGFLIPGGANNADKMRMYSIMLMLKDEIDAWPDMVGKDGDPDKLTDDRCSAFWEVRKIYRGGTPLVKGSSKIQYQYERGDQRVYKVRCKSCGFPQALRWHKVNEENGVVGGFHWETESGVLVPESVRYCCQNCGHAHAEHDKTKLFSPDYGAEWVPTATPAAPNIRSYHLPAFYSPAGFKPWHALVTDYLDGYDPAERKVTNIAKYRIFYNNVLGEPFEELGSKVQFTQVSAHRRSVYRLGQVPNTYAVEHSGSHVLFLVCTVDVHKSNLAVAVYGVCRDARLYVIDYQRIEDEDCRDSSSRCWSELRSIIEEKTFEADDGKTYAVALTLVDAGYANDTVSDFCAGFEYGVFPILGRERPAKNQQIKEFASFTTQSGRVGYRVLVDHYKDRMAPVLRREWIEEDGQQKAYHFNAPVDISDKALKELTVETKREKKDDRGGVVYYWHRPNADNELWDLTGYCYAAIEIFAHSICIDHFELDTVVWPQFWDYIEQEGQGQFYR